MSKKKGQTEEFANENMEVLKMETAPKEWTDYERLLEKIVNLGVERGDRTGTGTFALFAQQMRFDLTHSFPLITSKRVFWKGVVEELLWFLRGETNVRSLQAKGVSIWDEWADGNGSVGPVYGKQWRRWAGKPEAARAGGGSIHIKQPPIDQLAWLINEIKTNPDSRRLILSAWNVADIQDMALPPCHVMAQFIVEDNQLLHCHLYQRSGDMFLGVPFNIASYALLTTMIAHFTNLHPGELILTIGDAHIYKNHMPQVDEQLNRHGIPLPTLSIVEREGAGTIDNLVFEDFKLHDYNPHPAIKGEVSV